MTRRWFKRIIAVPAGVLLFLAAGLLLLFVFLQTGPGRQLAEAGLNRLLVWEQGQVVVSGFRGIIPFNFSIDHVAVHDGEGLWAEAGEVRLRWSVVELLFGGTLRVAEVGASSLVVQRRPETVEKEEEKEPFRLPEKLAWKWPLPPLRVIDLYLHSIFVSDAVFGTAAEFRLSSNLTIDREGFSVPEVRISRLDRTETELFLQAEWRQPAAELLVRVELTDSTTVPSLTGLEEWPELTTLSLQGRQEQARWQGALQVNAESLLEAGFEVDAFGLDRKSQVEIDGEINIIPPDRLPEPWPAYFADAFNLRLVLDMDGDKQQVSPSLSLESSFFRLLARVPITGPGREVEIDVDLDIFCGGPIWRQTGLAADFPLRLRIRGGGNFSRLQLHNRILLDGLSGYGLDLAGIDFTAEADFSRHEETPRLAIAGDLEVADLSAAAYPQLPDHLQAAFAVEYDMRDSLRIERFKIEAAEGREIILSGHMKVPAGTVSGAVDINLPAGAEMLPASIREPGLSGDFGLQGEFDGDPGKRVFSFDGEARLTDFSHPDPRLNDLIGPNVNLATAVTAKDGTEFRIRELSIDLARLNLTGGGSIDSAAEHVSFSGRLEAPDLAWLQAHTGHDIKGGMAVVLRGEGAFDELDLYGHIELEKMVFEPVGPFDVRLDWWTRLAEGLPFGGLTGAVVKGDEEIELAGGYGLKTDGLEIKDVAVKGAGIDLDGRLRLWFDQRLAVGEVSGLFTDLRRSGDFFSFPSVDGALETNVSLQVEDGRQNLDFSLAGRDLQAELITLAELEVDGRLRDLYHEPEFEVRIGAVEGRRGELYVEDCRLELSGTADEIDFTAAMSGQPAVPLAFELAGSYLASEQGHELNLAAWRGQLAGMDFVLLEPFQALYSAEYSELSPVMIKVGDGELSLAGQLAGERVEADLKLRELTLAALSGFGPEFPFDGRLALEAGLRGRLEEPELAARLDLDRLVEREDRIDGLEELSASLQFKLQAGDAILSLVIHEAETEVLQGGLQVPVAVSLLPFAFQFPEPVPLQGKLQGDVPLDRVGMLVMPPEQFFNGLLALDFSLSGDHRDPLLQGTAAVIDAHYEHFELGLLLDELQVRLEAEQDKITLRRLRAGDGNRGTLRGEGSLTLAPDTGMAWELGLEFADFRLLRHRMVTADIDRGRLQLAGDRQSGRIEGKVESHQVTVMIAEPRPPEVVDLAVREVNLPDNGRAADAVMVTDELVAKFPLELDIQLAFPARIYVRGRGLDSEWHGDLNITGTADRPRIHGQLGVVRGRITLLNRRFILDRDSYVLFDGSEPVDPLFEVLAYYRHRGRQAGIRVFGTAAEPELDLFADPPLPEDEILAWVLFGRSVADLTPLQALQLVHAAANLARGKPGLDIVGRVRSLLGVDDIDFVRDDAEGLPRLGVGMYVHERVYLQARTGLSVGDEMVGVEVELTPRISLESAVGTDREGGVGVFWRYDY